MPRRSIYDDGLLLALLLGCSTQPSDLPPAGTDAETSFAAQQEIDAAKMLDDIRTIQPDYEDPDDANVLYDDWREIALPADR